MLVGCPPSGTTLLRLMLDAHPDICCGPETHFLLEMQAIVERHWRRVQLFGFDRDYWLVKIAAFFDSFEREYAATKSKRLSDKTPRYTPHIRFLNDLFPSCQFVHVIRDPRDVVASHRERWGYRAAFDCAAGTWNQHVSIARDFGRTVPAGRYFELRFESLVRDPDTSLRQLLDFLGESWSPNVLNYQEFDHDYADAQGNLRDARKKPGQSGVDPSRAGRGRQTLAPLLVTVLRLGAGDLMKELKWMARDGSPPGRCAARHAWLDILQR